MDLSVRLGRLALETPLVAASGTVGSVVDFASVGALESYGAAVAKSVSSQPWKGRPQPRLAGAGTGMLNAIGIQNPGIEHWLGEVGPGLDRLPVPVWGSAVGTSVEEFCRVAERMATAPIQAVEVNLSCPNLERGTMFALDAAASAEVITAVRSAIELPVGAKLSPNASSIVEIARAVAGSGADWVTLTNTIWGVAIDVKTARPRLAGAVGGYSGPPLKPIALRCVWEVAEALPDLPIVGCGGVVSGDDVAEYLMAGAQAVALGTVHFAEPRAGRRILAELKRRFAHLSSISELVGQARR